jgi:tetratricopeptide (TPR) repeat protein
MEKSALQGDDAVANWRKLALAQWRAGDRTQAYLTLTKAMRKLGPEAQLHLQKGLFHAAEEDFELARQSLARAAEADCTCAEAHYCLGLVASAGGDTRLAVRSLQRAFHLRPADVGIAYQVALAARAAAGNGYHVVVHLPDACGSNNADTSQVRQLARYVAGESDFVESFLALPVSQVDPELFEVLLGVIQMALAEHPRYADLQFNCARALGRLNRRSEALEFARRAIEINPRYVKALMYLGQLSAEDGNTAEAIQYMQKAIACGADWPDVHCMTAGLMRQANQVASARAHLERALQLNAGYVRAAKELALLAA